MLQWHRLYTLYNTDSVLFCLLFRLAHTHKKERTFLDMKTKSIYYYVTKEISLLV